MFPDVLEPLASKVPEPFSIAIRVVPPYQLKPPVKLVFGTENQILPLSIPIA